MVISIGHPLGGKITKQNYEMRLTRMKMTRDRSLVTDATQPRFVGLADRDGAGAAKSDRQARPQKLGHRSILPERATKIAVQKDAANPLEYCSHIGRSRPSV
jgi:hypothetical protein